MAALILADEKREKEFGGGREFGRVKMDVETERGHHRTKSQTDSSYQRSAKRLPGMRTKALSGICSAGKSHDSKQTPMLAWCGEIHAYQRPTIICLRYGVFPAPIDGAFW